MADTGGGGGGASLLLTPKEQFIENSSSPRSQTVEEITCFDGQSNDIGVNLKSNGHELAVPTIESEMLTPQYKGTLYTAGSSGLHPSSRITERKRGHRRVTEDGQVTYKKKPMSELMSAIQLGIGQSIGSLTPKPMRDVLYEDFHVVETVVFPSEGSSVTPAHHYSDFRFKTFAPVAFRYFRELFNIKAEEFLFSLCVEPLQELSNPGASGSIFYITNDDEFIIKTVQRKEADFLQKLLPGYYMNLNQNPCTLLPKFYGLYCYQCSGKNIRFVVMNNLLPSYIALNEKYDLKGSTYKRRASRKERAKATPTLKDLDFVEQNPDGLLLEYDTYMALVRTIDRDCRVLQSFKIMDYSLLVGVHKVEKSMNLLDDYCGGLTPSECTEIASGRRKSLRPRVAIYTTAIESIQAASNIPDTNCRGGIPATNARGEQLSLYIGIIDILQSYRFAKKLEHTFKSMVLDGDTISVHQPGFYAQRFQNFFSDRVFRVKSLPGKRRSVGGRKKSLVPETEVKSDLPPDTQRPDILPQPTPPRPLSLSLSLQENVHKIGFEHKHLYTRHEGFARYKQSSEAVSQFTSMGSLTTSTASHTGVATSFTSSSPSKLSVNSSEIAGANAALQHAHLDDQPHMTGKISENEVITRADTLPLPVRVLVTDSECSTPVVYVAEINESTKL